MNDLQIAAALGCSTFTVRRWRDIHGLPRSQAKGSNTQWSTNRQFFRQIDSPAKAYVLGFVIADGCVHKNGKTLDIAVKEADAGILRAIAAEMGCDAPLHRKVGANGFGGKTRTTLRLNLCGREIVRDLNALGVYHDKTRSATLPTIDAELESHLIRGVYDGDGWIGKQQFMLIGTEAIVKAVSTAFGRRFGLPLTLGIHNGHWRAIGSRRHRPALQWLYADAPISLERKADAFRLYWS